MGTLLKTGEGEFKKKKDIHLISPGCEKHPGKGWDRGVREYVSAPKPTVTTCEHYDWKKPFNETQVTCRGFQNIHSALLYRRRLALHLSIHCSEREPLFCKPLYWRDAVSNWRLQVMLNVQTSISLSNETKKRRRTRVITTLYKLYIYNKSRFDLVRNHLTILISSHFNICTAWRTVWTVQTVWACDSGWHILITMARYNKAYLSQAEMTTSLLSAVETSRSLAGVDGVRVVEVSCCNWGGLL